MAKHNHEEKAAYDARTDVGSLQKAVLELASRIDNITTGEGSIELRKSAPSVEIPTTEALADISWADVHSLANKALTGGE